MCKDISYSRTATQKIAYIFCEYVLFDPLKIVSLMKEKSMINKKKRNKYSHVIMRFAFFCCVLRNDVQMIFLLCKLHILLPSSCLLLTLMLWCIEFRYRNIFLFRQSRRYCFFFTRLFLWQLCTSQILDAYVVCKITTTCPYIFSIIYTFLGCFIYF